MIQSIAETFSSFFDWRTSSMEHKIENEVIDDKKDAEKACEYAENAFLIVQRSAVFKSKIERKRFEYNLRRFRKLK